MSGGGGLRGRGSVAYEYRVGRTEVTTAQWVEFYNAFYDRAPHIHLPVRFPDGLTMISTQHALMSETVGGAKHICGASISDVRSSANSRLSCRKIPIGNAA